MIQKVSFSSILSTQTNFKQSSCSSTVHILRNVLSLLCQYCVRSSEPQQNCKKAFLFPIIRIIIGGEVIFTFRRTVKILLTSCGFMITNRIFQVQFYFFLIKFDFILVSKRVTQKFAMLLSKQVKGFDRWAQLAYLRKSLYCLFVFTCVVTQFHTAANRKKLISSISLSTFLFPSPVSVNVVSFL